VDQNSQVGSRRAVESVREKVARHSGALFFSSASSLWHATCVHQSSKAEQLLHPESDRIPSSSDNLKRIGGIYEKAVRRLMRRAACGRINHIDVERTAKWTAHMH
jgi:hypothetical protein